MSDLAKRQSGGVGDKPYFELNGATQRRVRRNCHCHNRKQKRVG